MRLTCKVEFPDGRFWHDGVKDIESGQTLHRVFHEMVDTMFLTADLSRMPTPMKASRISFVVEPEPGAVTETASSHAS